MDTSIMKIDIKRYRDFRAKLSLSKILQCFILFIGGCMVTYVLAVIGGAVYLSADSRHYLMLGLGLIVFSTIIMAIADHYEELYQKERYLKRE